MSFFSLTAHCPPPYVHLAPPRRLSSAEALSHIENYLADTSKEPHLHPDCRFNENGPTLDGRPPGGGITLHQLGRIVRGLKGERLGPEVEAVDVDDDEVVAEPPDDIESATVASQRDILPTGDDERLDALIAQTARQRRDADGVESDTVDASYTDQMRAQGEDGILEGEIGPRDTGLRDDAAIPNVSATAGEKLRGSKKRAVKEHKHPAPSTKDDTVAEGPMSRKRARTHPQDAKHKEREPVEVDEAEAKRLRKLAKKKMKMGMNERQEQNGADHGSAKPATDEDDALPKPREARKSKMDESNVNGTEDIQSGKKKKKKREKQRDKSTD